MRPIKPFPLPNILFTNTKNMKTKILMPLALILGLSFAGMAQEREHKTHTPEERAKKMTEKMTEKLSLTNEQKTAVYEANLAMAKESEEARAQRKETIKAHDDAMKKALTEKQYETYKNLRKEQREKHREHRREGKSHK